MGSMSDMIETFGGHIMSPVPDPYPAYARLRRDEPVKCMDLPLGPTYLVTRYDDVLAVLRDNALFSSAINGRGIGLVMGRTIIEMDAKEHTRHRNIVSMNFVPKALQGDLPAHIGRVANELIDRFAADGGADIVEQFTKTFPLRVIAHVIGIPIDDYETFQRWSLDIIGFTSDPPRGFAASNAIVEFLRPIIEDRQAHPAADLLSTLVHAEVDGHRLTEEEVYSFLRLLLPAGAETTQRLIGTTLFALLSHREQFEAVLADRSQLAWAIEEALRWEAPVQFAARNATADTVIAGTAIPTESQVMVAIGSANRDERHYDSPARFDIRRHADDHLSFGFGRHFCLGSHLARMEATTALNAFFDRLPHLRLDPAAPPPQVVGLAFRSPDRVPVRFDRTPGAV